MMDRRAIIIQTVLEAGKTLSSYVLCMLEKTLIQRKKYKHYVL